MLDHLTKFFLFLCCLSFAEADVIGQNCLISEYNSEIVLTSQGNILDEITNIGGSDVYLSILYVVVGFESEGYKLNIDYDGSYKLYFITKDQTVLQKVGKIDSGEGHICDSLILSKKGIYISRCQSTNSSNSLSLLLIKQKNDMLKIYSLDDEMQRTLNENKVAFNDALLKFNLINNLQNTEIPSHRKTKRLGNRKERKN